MNLQSDKKPVGTYKLYMYSGSATMQKLPGSLARKMFDTMKEAKFEAYKAAYKYKMQIVIVEKLAAYESMIIKVITPQIKSFSKHEITADGLYEYSNANYYADKFDDIDLMKDSMNRLGIKATRLFAITAISEYSEMYAAGWMMPFSEEDEYDVRSEAIRSIIGRL